MANLVVRRGNEELYNLYCDKLFNSKELVHHILSQLCTFVDLSRLQLVCTQWHKSLKPRFALHVAQNFEKITLLKVEVTCTQILFAQPKIKIDDVRKQVSSMAIPSILRGPMGAQYENKAVIRSTEYADLQILIETARAKSCVNVDEARGILAEVKTRAMQLGWIQGQINTLAKIVKIEIGIDPDLAEQNLSVFEALASQLQEPYISYAHVKIAELKGYIQQEDSHLIPVAKQRFLDAARVERQKTQSTLDAWGGVSYERPLVQLIDFAWLEAPVCLEQAKETIQLVAEKMKSVGIDFLGLFQRTVVINKEGPGMDLLQKQLCSELMYTGMKCTNEQVTDGLIAADRKMIHLQPATAENFETMKIAALASREGLLQLQKESRFRHQDSPLVTVQQIQMQALHLIEVARYEATLDREAAWATLMEVLPFAAALEDRTYVVVQLFKQTLRI